MRRLAWLLFGFVVLPVGLIALAYLSGTRPGAWALLNVLTFPLLILVVIVTHEAGHALAGRALGLSVPRVEVGMGPRVGRWRWRRTTIQLNTFPTGGMTHLSATRETGLRWRLWLATAAGPAVTASLLGVAWLVPPSLTLKRVLLQPEVVATRPAPRELLAFYAILILVGNLWPLDLRRRAGRWNDGRQLLLLPFQRTERLREAALTTGAILEAEELGERQDLDGAQRVLEEALHRVPGSWPVLNSLAIVTLDRGRLAEARTMFLDLLAREAPLPAFGCLLSNNLAWVDFRIRDPDLRAEADEHSATAAANLKDQPAVMGTRGAVLVWLGRSREALPLLERAYLLSSRPESRALNACCLAWGLGSLGRHDEGRRWLERARANHASSPLLGDAEAALQSDAVPPQK
jgi:hypothetical protein